MAQRKLAYANNPGVAHVESSWIEARRTLHGETKDQAEAEIKRLVETKNIIVIEPEGG